MRVWLVTVGEPLPTDGGGEDRLLRTGLLAQHLVEAGHTVVWWTSAFDHVRKVHRVEADGAVDLGPRYRIWLLRGPGYQKHVSLRRYLEHREVARRFTQRAESEPRPHVILCSLPTIELSMAATRYGRQAGVPVILDIRDLWPEVLLDLLPFWARGPARLAIWPLARAVAQACARATAVVAVSPGYVRWGLALAGRQATALDRDFPHAYSEQVPTDAEVARARAFWTRHGLGGGDAFICCFFGTFGRQFDLETVLRAARILEKERPSILFVLCGHGDRFERFAALARGRPNVLLPGWVGRAEIWTLMRMAAVGLAPYRCTRNFQEGLPNKPIEYLSAGLPVVSGLRGYLEELLAAGGCGVTYVPGDAADLARRLRELARAPEKLRQMAQRAFALYRERFVAEKVYPLMVRYLEKVVVGQ
jgi:glycosyltransferase involved in cell wall biosynthesis